jgi:hypothetical protein
MKKIKILLLRSLLCIGFLSPLLVSAQTIESENFVLKDDYGRMTAQLTKSWEGTPALFFYDTKWVPRITIWLYGDGVPGIVLNDEKWLASALLRMVNNQRDPVLVLKENGQDRFVLGKNGIGKVTESSPIGTMTIILLSLISGWVGGFLVFLMMQKKGWKNPESIFVKNALRKWFYIGAHCMFGFSISHSSARSHRCITGGS